MTIYTDGAKAYQILALRAKDPRTVERYLDMEKRLKKLDKMMKKLKTDKPKHALELQPGIDASISLSKKTKKDDKNYAIYNSVTRSLQGLQNFYLGRK